MNELTDTWYPQAQRSAVFPGCGPFVHGPYRIVLHTTEGDSIAGAIIAYHASGNYPHFTVDGRTVEQHCGLDVGSTALKHPAGTGETNRAGAIQIEIVGFAQHIDAISADTTATLRALLAWVMEQTGVQPVYPPVKPYPASYGANNGIRFNDTEWAAWNGICCHEHVPSNDHGDAGAIDFAAFVGAPTPIPTPSPLQEDDEMSNLTIVWPDGAKSILTADGAVNNWPLADGTVKAQPAPGYGSFYSLRPDERLSLNWPLKVGDVRSLCPVDINDKAAGVVAGVIGSDGRAYEYKFDAGFAKSHGLSISHQNKLTPREKNLLTSIETLILQNPAKVIGWIASVASAIAAFIVTLQPSLSHVNGWGQTLIVIGAALIPFVQARFTNKAVAVAVSRGTYNPNRNH